MSAAGAATAVAGSGAAAATDAAAGTEAAILTLRATRTLKPARSISISVRLVSSSNKASSRMSAPSLVANFAAALSSGWRAMILIRNSLSRGLRGPSGLSFQVSIFRSWLSGLGLDAELGCKAADRKAVAVNAETRKCREGGPGGKGVVAEALAGVDVADMDLDRRDFHRAQRIGEGVRSVRVGARIEDDAGRLLGMGFVDEVDQLTLPV